MKTLGIIDIGSNSIKLIIVEIHTNSYSEIFHKKFQTRLFDFVGTDYVKQNDAELSNAVGYKIDSEEKLYEAAQDFLIKMQAKGILITRGEKGMTLFEKNGDVHNIPVSDKSEVFDVSGAGDTCVATFITALAAGALPSQAAEISNFASGIAVRKIGTATVSDEELINVLKK